MRRVSLVPMLLAVALSAAACGQTAEREALADVAVLPFANLSSDPEQDYFADGLTEEIINQLAQSPDLRVAARSSSFAFKGRTVDPRTIGETLGVAAALEGSVRRAGDRVRVAAQLVDTSNGASLWSATYDRELDDVFAMQEDIARAVAQELGGVLADPPAAE
jgi:TolB-like protein